MKTEDKVQFNAKIPEDLKLKVMIQVAKDKKEHGNKEKIITKLLEYYAEHGLPVKAKPRTKKVSKKVVKK